MSFAARDALASELTLNGQQYSAPVPFRVRPAPRLDGIWPRSTFAHGGSVVTFTGVGFWDDLGGADAALLRCRVGATSVPATFVNATHVYCPVPVRTTAEDGASLTVTAHVSVAHDGMSYRQSNLQFTYASGCYPATSTTVSARYVHVECAGVGKKVCIALPVPVDPDDVSAVFKKKERRLTLRLTPASSD